MLFQTSEATVWFLFFVLSFQFVSAEEGCYGAGFVATSVVLAVLVTLFAVGAAYYWVRRRPKTEHLILETDPEKGKAEYAFDNPGFKDTTLAKSQEKSPSTNDPEKAEKQKWNNWAFAPKIEKKKTLDDSFLTEPEVKVVALKSHDFAGLGFNICGNMKEGIYIKDILHRGPASESGKLNPGDRIKSVTINFEHIVYEDALNILSFASPYEIIVEAKGGKILFGSSSKSDHPSHPMYRSPSGVHSQEASKITRKRLSTENSLDTNCPSIHKSLSNTTTLERKNSKSPRPIYIPADKHQENPLNPEQLKNQLEQRITSAGNEMRLKTEPIKLKIETQKTDNKHQKFGIKVFPTDLGTSPKTGETSQNHKNFDIENHEVNPGFDEVDAKTLCVKTENILQSKEHFDRNDSVYGSGLKRDENGIPQEIPSHMLNAAVAARRNRKSQVDIFSEEDAKVTKKIKSKAPSPPTPTNEKSEEGDGNFNFKETTLKIKTPQYSHSDIHTVQNEKNMSEKNNNPSESNVMKKFCFDSDEETDNQSVNTIELNLCDITIHQIENEEKQSRKTASTGDLTKIHKTRKSSTGTLERAQSLDITDSGIPNLTQNKIGDKDIFDINSEEDLFGKAMLNKEPRLSHILDGLNTFQRNRLKKSTEWGNLEDAIFRSNPDQESISQISELNNPSANTNLKGDKSAELNAVVNKINEIKKESQEKSYMKMKDSKEDMEIRTTHSNLSKGFYEDEKPKNQLWPTEIETSINLQPVNTTRVMTKSAKPVIELKHKINVQNEIWPKELEKNVIDQGKNEKDVDEFTTEVLTEYQNENGLNKESIELERMNARNGIIAMTKTHSNKKEHEKSYKEPLSPLKTFTEYQENISVESDNRMINNDPIMGLESNSGNMDDMIVSETPPDAISELEPTDLSKREITNKEITMVNVNSNPESKEILPTIVSNKIETHKRQQIPFEENKILLPPEISQPDIEKGMSAELNDETSFSKVSEGEFTNVSTELVAPSSSQPHIEHLYKGEASFSGFERNSETGELFTAVNNTDESKTINETTPKYLNDTENFILNEKYLNNQNRSYDILPGDINVSDDIKVGRHSFGTSEIPKSDDAKSIESIKYSSNVSNVTVNDVHTENGTSHLHSLELAVNDNSSSGDAMNSLLGESDLYTTALNQSLETERETSKISISTPDLIKNVTITEAINTLNGDMDQIMSFGESSNDNHAIHINSKKDSETTDFGDQKSSMENTQAKHSSLTYITEIQVTPTSANTNVSEIEILPPTHIPSSQFSKNSKVENFVKNYEIESLDPKKEYKTQHDSKNKIGSYISRQFDPEKEMYKIQEIAQEQLKKLPEMKFSTSSYESPVKNVEMKQSQVELLKSNFEKSPPKSLKTDMTRSRIPISTTMKTPPTSPEHRESREPETDNEKETFEFMPSSMHSTPMTNISKNQKLTSNKNVTITSIRTNSRIPSGLPVVIGIRPPVPPKRTDPDNDSLSSTNSSISSFKQWVFNPVNSVTNIPSPGNHNNK